jgi:hypothetical protein
MAITSLDTEIAVCCAALRLLDYNPIQSFEDDTEAAHAVALYYNFCRRKLLSVYPWSFAQAYYLLERRVFDRTAYLPYTKDPTPADPNPGPYPELPVNFPELMGFKYAYRLPDDYLNLLMVYDYGNRPLVQWSDGLMVSGADYVLSQVHSTDGAGSDVRLLCNVGRKFGYPWAVGADRREGNPKISYVGDVVNVKVWSSDFLDCFLYFFAGYLVETLKGHNDQAKSVLNAIFEKKFGEAKINESRRKQLGGWGMPTALMAARHSW